MLFVISLFGLVSPLTIRESHNVYTADTQSVVWYLRTDYNLLYASASISPHRNGSFIRCGGPHRRLLYARSACDYSNVLTIGGNSRRVRSTSRLAASCDVYIIKVSYIVTNFTLYVCHPELDNLFCAYRNLSYWAANECVGECIIPAPLESYDKFFHWKISTVALRAYHNNTFSADLYITPHFFCKDISTIGRRSNIFTHRPRSSCL